MSDGPFKNSKLGKCWKRFAEAVQNETFDNSFRRDLAYHAIMQEILKDSVRSILARLLACASKKQLDMDPLSLVNSIFSDHMMTPFTDTLQKQLAFRLHDQVPMADAIRQAVEATVNEHSKDTRNRIVDEFISVREAGKIQEAQFSRNISIVHAIFKELKTDKICAALFVGDKNAFKNGASKKRDIEDGPPL